MTTPAHDETLEPALAHAWYAVADASLVGTTVYDTRLFGQPIRIARSPGGEPRVMRADASSAPVVERYGFIWSSPGQPEIDVLDIPEALDPERHVICGGSFGVHVSGLRAVENFLDMGHFPFVHTDYLGVEPHTEVKPYAVEVDGGALVATQCQFFQPVASPTANDGMMVD